MTLDQALTIFTENLELIIEVLFLVIVFLSAVLFAVWYRARGEEEDQQFGKIEQTLKRVLEQTRQDSRVQVALPLTPQKPAEDLSELPAHIREMTDETAVSLGAGGGASGPAMAGHEVLASTPSAQFQIDPNTTLELEKIKMSLVEKERQLENLQKALKDAEAMALTPGQEKGAGAPHLEAKIKELESKLAEYEIIEDDIADLSLYKQENVRLKQELENLKVKYNISDEAASAPGAKKTADEDLMREFENAVSEQKAATQDIDADLMKEFEAAVAEQKTGKPAAQASPPPPVATEVSPPAVEKKAPEEAKTTTKSAEPDDGVSDLLSDDIMKQFAAAVSGDSMDSASAIATPLIDPNEKSEDTEQEKPAPVTAEDLEAATVDTEKMMSEVSTLDASAAGSLEELEKNIDTEKMAEEASGLEKKDKA